MGFDYRDYAPGWVYAYTAPQDGRIVVLYVGSTTDVEARDRRHWRDSSWYRTPGAQMRLVAVHALGLLRPIETWAQLHLNPRHLKRYGVHVTFYSCDHPRFPNCMSFIHIDEAEAFWKTEGFRHLSGWSPPVV
jgi:hypothetical protein